MNPPITKCVGFGVNGFPLRDPFEADSSESQEPRRCETNQVGAAGECLACDAEQGETCLQPRSIHYAPRRTKLQIEADRLDLEIFRLRGRLDDFAKRVNSSSLAMDAMHLGRARSLIWRHMHPRDREKINV